MQGLKSKLVVYTTNLFQTDPFNLSISMRKNKVSHQNSSETDDSEDEILRALNSNRKKNRTNNSGGLKQQEQPQQQHLQIRLKLNQNESNTASNNSTSSSTSNTNTNTNTNNPTNITLPSDMDPEPVCPVCLKIIIGDYDEFNEHIDECINENEHANENENTREQEENTELTNQNHTEMIPSVLSRTPSAYSLINVDEDDVNYGKCQYSEADIDKALRKKYSKDDEVEIKNSLLIKNILSSPCLNADFGNLQVALKSLLDRLATAPKCAVCWEILKMPATVSINCWHICCEDCWLKTLGTKRLCPHCSSITNPSDLRKVFF
jgi:hypothetical protein